MDAIHHVPKFNRVVVTALRLHVKPASQELERELGGGLAAFVEGVAGSLERWEGELRLDNEVLARELSESASARKERDEAREKLYGALSGLSRVSEAAFGAEFLRGLHLAGLTPLEGEALLRRADDFLSVELPSQLPAPREAWMVPDLGAARETIRAHRDAYKVRLHDHASEERETQAARDERRGSFEAWQAEVRFAVAMGRAILRRAGRQALAEQILPTERQVDRLESPAPPEEPTPA